MLTAIAVVVLILVTLMYAAVPLLARRQVDPLPDERDPLLVDLEEERDALLRAIRELDARDDLPAARRDLLRARYESKAARVLKALEAYHAKAVGHAAPARSGPRRLPIGALSLLAIAVVATASLGSFVLPRVGQGTVTTFFADDLRAAEALRDLMGAAERDPTVANLMALADAYVQAGPEYLVDAERTYRRVLDAAATDTAGTGQAPALAYQRLALLIFETDLPAALDLLRTARLVDPTDAETLYGIAELSFAVGDLDAAAEAFRAFLATPAGADDGAAAERLALVEAMAPAAAALAEARTVPNLLAMADVFWRAGAMEPAAELYFEVLGQLDPLEPTATSRMGQFVFTRGRNDDAIALIERAAGIAGGLTRLDPQASLFLGNAYALTGDDASAVRAWEAHVALVGEDAAGRVPGLVEAARGRLAGDATADDPASVDPPVATATPPTVASPPTDATAPSGAGAGPTGAEAALAALSDPHALLAVGDDLYRAHCAVCHGSTGQGGAGPRLAGNARAANEANVRSLVRFGRGVMPGFGALLAESEVEVLVRWVGQELALPR